MRRVLLSLAIGACALTCESALAQAPELSRTWLDCCTSAEALASLDRFKKIAANAKATVVIQQDARDVTRLPAYPTAAK